MSKIRLDQYLCQNGLVQSRERAKALIMSGIVFVNEQKVDKAGEMIAPDAKVEVRGHDIGYVRRGGLKPTACCKTARSRSMPGTLATASWRGAYAQTSALSIWRERTSAA